MSLFHLSGNFGVAGASRVSSAKQVGERSVTTFHYIYDTTITFRGGPSIQANLRVYSPPNDTPFAEQSIVFAFCKAYAPLNGTVLLDAISVYPYSGNPDDETYDNAVLDFPGTFVYVSGIVRSQPEPLASHHGSRFFTVESTEYVREISRVSTLQMVFDGSSARWNRISPPALRTTVEIFGHCRGVSDTGALMINIDDIAFNLGARMPAEEATNDEGGSSRKRRKFSPYATRKAPTTTQPSSVASTSQVGGSQTSVNPVNNPTMLSFNPNPSASLFTPSAVVPSASASVAATDEHVRPSPVPSSPLSSCELPAPALDRGHRSSTKSKGKRKAKS